MDFGAGFRKLTLGAFAVSSFFFGGSAASAQQVTGTLGSADATTMNGKQNPPKGPTVVLYWKLGVLWWFGMNQLSAADKQKAAEMLAAAHD